MKSQLSLFLMVALLSACGAPPERVSGTPYSADAEVKTGNQQPAQGEQKQNTPQNSGDGAVGAPNTPGGTPGTPEPNQDPAEGGTPGGEDPVGNGGGETPEGETPAPGGETPAPGGEEEGEAALDGAALFQASCQKCHSPEEMAGKKAQGILGAINRIPAMSGLKAKFPEVNAELQAIEKFLAE